MPKPHKTEFFMKGTRVTSLVVDEAEFAEIVSSCSALLTEDRSKILIDAKHIPIMSRGAKTEHVFTKYEVVTQFLSVIVRGAGEELAKKYGINPGTAREIMGNQN